VKSSRDMSEQIINLDRQASAAGLAPWSGLRAPLGIRDFGVRGRGIIALRDIQPDHLVERSPVLIIPSGDRSTVDKTIIFTYVFMWEHDSVEQDLYEHRGRSAIALGYTSLLSHSSQPNCIFIRHIDELFIDVFAKRYIAVGEELTIDYEMTLWFEPIKIG
jgi:hypothetical protein